MTYDLVHDKEFQAIAQGVSNEDGLLKDVWISYQGAKWYPVMIKDQKSGARGFELNPTGEWGKNEVVGREKVNLGNLIWSLARADLPARTAIRCKRISLPQRNGRNVSDIEVSPRLRELMNRLNPNQLGTQDSEMLLMATTGSGSEVAESTESVSNITEPPMTPESLRNEQSEQPLDANEQASTGYESDPKIRKAVEDHAVGIACTFYKERGYSVTEKGKPYDLLCTKSGEVIHVEVKGSRSSLDAIIVTTNEVTDARDAGWRSDLFLVDNIVLASDDSGRRRLSSNWLPEDKDLTPIQFRYKLPPIPDAE